MKIYDLFRHEDDFYGGQKRQETDLGWVDKEDIRMFILDFSGGGGAGGKSLWDAAREIVVSREQGKFWWIEFRKMVFRFSWNSTNWIEYGSVCWKSTWGKIISRNNLLIYILLIQGKTSMILRYLERFVDHIENCWPLFF